MANRAQRRAMMRSETGRSRKLIESYTYEQRVAGLIQNGITPEDVKREFDRGYEAGFKDASVPIIKACYAAVCLALNEEFGFGAARSMRVLKSLDDKLVMTLTHDELTQEVFDRMDLTINWDEPFDRIEGGK